MRNPIIIATRGSELALWQANYVKSLLEEIGLKSELNIIKTQGDQIQHLSLDKLEGKGFFTKEIEDALLNGTADIAVHSHKDLPTVSPEGLMIAAVSDREDPSELLLIRPEAVDARLKWSLKNDPIVGTSSARRKSQLLSFRPDIKLKDLRGNVPTRINKLREGHYDAILIAAAGVERLELDISDLHVEKLDPKELIPAPAQGVLAIQIRSSDRELAEKLLAIDHSKIRVTIGIERKVLNLFHGGCHMPVGAYADYDDEREVYSARVSYASAWDKLPVSVYSESKDPVVLAERLVDKIRNIKPQRVFVTREMRREDHLRHVLEANGFSYECRSLITMKPVVFGKMPTCDWIFFSSKHAVKYFFDQKPELKGQRIGCIGKATADEVRKYSQRAEFIGGSADTRMTGKQFAGKAGDGIVLFPQAKGSLRTVQQQFVKKSQVVDLVVYESLKRNEGTAPQADLIVFTSPSNVEAWFENYKISRSQRIVAMGDATAHTLKDHGVYADAMPDAFDDSGLARAVFGASSLTK